MFRFVRGVVCLVDWLRARVCLCGCLCSVVRLLLCSVVRCCAVLFVEWEITGVVLFVWFVWFDVEL